MNTPDRIRIEHISEAISEIESYVEEISQEEFIKNSLIRSASVRQYDMPKLKSQIQKILSSE